MLCQCRTCKHGCNSSPRAHFCEGPPTGIARSAAAHLVCMLPLSHARASKHGVQLDCIYRPFQLHSSNVLRTKVAGTHPTALPSMPLLGCSAAACAPPQHHQAVLPPRAGDGLPLYSPASNIAGPLDNLLELLGKHNNCCRDFVVFANKALQEPSTLLSEETRYVWVKLAC